MLHELRDIFGPFAERRQFEGNHGKPVIQIFPKGSILDHGLKIAVRGCNDPDIDLARFGCANLFDFALLNEAEHFNLELERHLADFIEEQCSVMREFDSSSLVRHRAGEGTLDVTEEFGFEQVLWNSAAIDGDERLVLATAVVVDRSGEQFFSGAGFGVNQYGRVGSGCASRHLED